MRKAIVYRSEEVDRILDRLARRGVGSVIGSVNVMSLEMTRFNPFLRDEVIRESTVSEKMGNTYGGRSRSNTFMSVHGGEETAKQECPLPAPEEVTESTKNANSVFRLKETASQIRIEQMIEQMEIAATMNFDFIMLITMASVIAGIGLVTNNIVALVASMLISPMMGPVLALTFGATICDWPLSLLGLRSELISLTYCIFVGFVIGLVTIGFGTGGGSNWPTDEMKSRGVAEGLAIGLAIAIPSGMGVALSILGNNTTSLVGVAISASLLPPAVNCGIAFAYAAAGFQRDPDAVDDDHLSDFTTSESYTRLGGISLALTVVNIVAIFFSAWTIFRIKEIAPQQNKSQLWQHGIQAFREYIGESQPGAEATSQAHSIRSSVRAFFEGVSQNDETTRRARPKSLPVGRISFPKSVGQESQDDMLLEMMEAIPFSPPPLSQFLSSTEQPHFIRNRERFRARSPAPTRNDVAQPGNVQAKVLTASEEEIGRIKKKMKESGRIVVKRTRSGLH
eukprot:scaffold681_cov173-Ochromonas_danica.AAC.30